MKLLFITPYYAPAWDFGGPVRAAEGLAVALVERGHDVHVWTSDVSSRSTRVRPTQREEIRDGVRVKRYPTWALGSLQRFNMFVTPDMGWSRRSGPFDVVHLHEFRTFQNAWMLPRLALHGVPFVLTPHGAFARRGRVAFKIAYDILAGNWMINRARFLTALTPREAGDMQRLGVAPNRIRVLPNGVGHLANGTQTKSQARAQFGLSEEAQVVLFLGRLHPIKGPDLLLNAFARVLASQPRGTLVFAGPDEGSGRRLRQAADDLAVASQVRFLGSVVGEEKEAAYAAADVVVLPSRSEGLPVTLLEALLRRKPVVCTDTCAFDPALSDYTEVVRPDPVGIALGLSRVLSDPARAARRAAAGTAFVQRGYTLDRVAALAEQIYVEASSSR